MEWLIFFTVGCHIEDFEFLEHVTPSRSNSMVGNVRPTQKVDLPSETSRLDTLGQSVASKDANCYFPFLLYRRAPANRNERSEQQGASSSDSRLKHVPAMCTVLKKHQVVAELIQYDNIQ